MMGRARGERGGRDANTVYNHICSYKLTQTLLNTNYIHVFCLCCPFLAWFLSLHISLVAPYSPLKSPNQAPYPESSPLPHAALCHFKLPTREHIVCSPRLIHHIKKAVFLHIPPTPAPPSIGRRWNRYYGKHP